MSGRIIMIPEVPLEPNILIRICIYLVVKLFTAVRIRDFVLSVAGLVVLAITIFFYGSPLDLFTYLLTIVSERNK